jgi:hypothetical protein
MARLFTSGLEFGAAGLVAEGYDQGSFPTWHRQRVGYDGPTGTGTPRTIPEQHRRLPCNADRAVGLTALLRVGGARSPARRRLAARRPCPPQLRARSDRRARQTRDSGALLTTPSTA